MTHDTFAWAVLTGCYEGVLKLAVGAKVNNNVLLCGEGARGITAIQLATLCLSTQSSKTPLEG